MVNEKRLIYVNAALEKLCEYCSCGDYEECDFRCGEFENISNIPTVDAVEVPCRCCDCYYLLNGKNSFGLYFFCGHQNGLKNLKNTEKDFCMYGKRRYENETESDA